MGEYVFDHAWADAYERAGGRYYPKLQVSVPFTPVTGPRLLVAGRAPGGGGPPASRSPGCGPCGDQTGASSIHATFLQEADADALCRARLPAPQRPAVPLVQRGLRDLRRFPRRPLLAQAQGHPPGAPGRARGRDHGRMGHRAATSRRPTGTPSSPSTWIRARANGAGPTSTGASSRSSASGWPTGCSWSWRSARAATSPGRINFIGDTRLYGRNWGCIEDHPFLHFEVCYYQAIDFAIAPQLDRVEAGAQGRAQARPRLPAGHHVLGPRHRRSRPEAGRRRLSASRSAAT